LRTRAEASLRYIKHRHSGRWSFSIGACPQLNDAQFDDVRGQPCRFSAPLREDLPAEERDNF
jgi:hypothetical protein